MNCTECERMAKAEVAIANMTADFKEFRRWLMGLFGTSFISTILLAANLVIKGSGH